MACTRDPPCKSDEDVPHAAADRVAAVHQRRRVAQQVALGRAQRARVATAVVEGAEVRAAALVLVQIVERDVEREHAAVAVRAQLALPGARVVLDDEGLAHADRVARVAAAAVAQREIKGVRDEGPRDLGEQLLAQPAQRLWQLLHRHVGGGVARVPRGRPAAARRGDRLALGDDVIARGTVDERLARVADERARAHDRLVRRHCHVAVEGEGFVLSNALAQSRQGLGRRREDAVWYREPKRRRNGGGVVQSDLAVDLAVAQPPRTSAVGRPARALANLLPALVSADLGAAVNVRVAAGPLKGASDKATFVDVAARVGGCPRPRMRL